MHDEYRIQFEAEQRFLEAVSMELSPHAEKSVRFERLSQRIEELSSTEMSAAVALSYGFNPQHKCFADGDIARTVKKSRTAVNDERNVVLASLWMVYGQKMIDGGKEFWTHLAAKYDIRAADASSPRNRKMFERAASNVAYYNDVQFVKSIPNLSVRINQLYGEKARTIFDQYYRLGAYAKQPNQERQGAFRFKSTIPERVAAERLSLTDALEAGRATAEYYAKQGEVGDRVWSNLRGMGKGFRRKGTRFFSVLSEYQSQVEVARLLKSKGSLGLSNLERELLRLTSASRLCGSTKQAGVDEFNAKHGATQYEVTDVAVLEKKLRGGVEKSRLLQQERMERMGKVLKSSVLQGKISQTIAGMVLDFHVYKVKLERIAVDNDMSLTGCTTLIQMISKLIVQSSLLPKQGDISEHMVNTVFRGESYENLPEAIYNLISVFSKHKTIPEAITHAPKGYWDTQGITGLRSLINRMVEDHERMEQREKLK